MASVKFKKGSTEWNFFNEFWQMVQCYYEVEDDEKYWGNVAHDVEMLAHKYNSFRLGKMLIIAFYICQSISYTGQKHTFARNVRYCLDKSKKSLYATISDAFEVYAKSLKGE